MEEKSKHENKLCPRCGARFECKVGDITRCQCYGLVFTETQERAIRLQYDDCLCRACLEAITKEIV